jgi:hypothetical protein
MSFVFQKWLEKKMQKKTIEIISEGIILRYMELWHVAFQIF